MALKTRMHINETDDTVDDPLLCQTRGAPFCAERQDKRRVSSGRNLSIGSDDGGDNVVPQLVATIVPMVCTSRPHVAR